RLAPPGGRKTGPATRQKIAKPMTAPLKTRVALAASQAGRRGGIQPPPAATPSRAGVCGNGASASAPGGDPSEGEDVREWRQRDRRVDERPAGDVNSRHQRREREQDRGVDEER